MGKAALYASLPFTMLVTLGLGYYAGRWIDEQYGFRYANLIGIVLGLGLGLYEVLRQLKRLEKSGQ
jgi:VIT1/CCC1 family predicted Fe2+/Mn2+ transporter